MRAQDITLKMAEGWFNLRVGALIISSGRILMVKNSGSAFYYTVGGRVHFGETAREAVLREAYEETGLRFEIDRLAYIHENFFVQESSGEPYHELTLFYRMKLNPLAAQISTRTFSEGYGQSALYWLDADALKTRRVYPGFLNDELNNPSNTVIHYITKDNKTQLMDDY